MDSFGNAAAHNIVFLAAIAAFTVGSVAGVIAKAWRKVRTTEMEATLKQDMIARGMSADDIERVLRAGPVSAEATADLRRASSGTDLATVMAANGYDGEDIEKVIKALGELGEPAPAQTAVLSTMITNGYDGDDILRVIKALPRQTRPATA